MKNWNGHGDALVAPRRTPAGSRFRIAAFVTFVLIAGLNTVFPSLKHQFIPKPGSQPPARTGYAPESFQWSQIKPKKHLEFHKCFDGFECAKLSLPLDYFNGTYPDDTVSVAIAKLPAKVTIDDPRYGGPILLNPGGPGGPGALFALKIANSLQWVVDSSSDPASTGKDARFFDIIGFDPRGIGETEPAANCISDPAAAWSWTMRETEEGILGSSDAALGRLWSMTHAFGSSCKLAMDEEDGPDIKQYMTTAFVARDMLEIVERHAEYNAHQVAQATRNNGKRSGCRNTGHPKYTPGEAKLQYWGFSYGTILGSTFASMFPDRVGRLVLDGVVNDYDYNHSLGNGSLIDNEKAMESFYSYCLLSGYETCPLGGNATTTAEIKSNTERILKSLYHNPFILSSAEGPEVVTYSDIKITIFSSIYQPQISFESLGHLLRQIEAGSGDLIDLLSRPFRVAHTLSCGINGTVHSTISDTGDVPTFAILCADGVDQQDVSIDDFVEYWHLLQGMSSAAGDVWALLKMKCAAWKIRASYKFDGELGGNTSHPILFVSNTADPVTPLRSGRIMHSKFPNSGLLVNDQAGHCSFSVTNLCAYDRIKDYFQTGTLPAMNTLCIPPPSVFSLNSTDPKSPFYDPTLEVGTSIFTDSQIGTEQQKMHSAAKTLQRVMADSETFGFSGLIRNEKAASIQKMSAAKYLD
ncbi:hypothetical protein BU25DRAFT_410405 [Macroventuria anomochaeta]|uniref:Uncharacterized protein n=1 Tax=Macroventuria anomochaeta TaxID=301207 RepID=A0ACB6S2Y1_9PLEO|nr:uncharacterized protein BU25DRAFT_410405 [Macroventuria anomochaeta]KAF2627749.1 hypothetical protein BU25DRAFT_410405 [Macroventuria anomochaeta]